MNSYVAKPVHYTRDMTRFRIALGTVCLLLLTALVTGWYIHQNLSSLLRQQAVHYLTQYGVEDIDYEGLHISLKAVRIETLQARGHYDTQSWRATAHNTELQYHWSTLLGGRAESLNIENLELRVSSDRSAGSPDTSAGPLSLPLPHELVAQLPLAVLQVEQWRIDYSGVHVPPLHASGSLRLAEQIELQFDSALADTLIRASIATGDTPDVLTLSVALSDQSQSQSQSQSRMANIVAQLQPVDDNRWRWRLQSDWESAALLAGLRRLYERTRLLPALATLDSLTVQGQGSLSLAIQHPTTLHAGPDDTTLRVLQQLDISGDLVQELQQFDYADMARSMRGRAVVSVEHNERNTTITLAPTGITGELATRLFQLPTATRTWLQWGENTPILWRNPQALSATSANLKDWHLNLDTSGITIGTPASQMMIDVQSMQIDLDIDTPAQFNTRLHTQLNTTLRNKPLPPLELLSTQRGNTEQIDFQLQVSDLPKNLTLDLQGNLNPVTGGGKYTLHADSERLPQLAATLTPLLHHFKLWQHPVSLSAGTFSLSTTLTSTDGDLSSWQQQSRLSLDSVSGSFDDIQFERLSANAQWQGIDAWQTLQPATISLESMQPGFALDNVRATISLPHATPPAQPRIQIEAFSADLFGGDVALVEPVVWDVGATSNSLMLRAKRWQLAELVALQQNTDIQAEGVLEGELPLRLVDGRAVINNGFLRALPPGGTIRYRANDASRAMAADSAEMALALGLLSDFHYNALGSTVQLDKGGTLLLGLSLAGSNPSMYEGQAVNFNINLEQNIDPLLQSLQLSDKLIRRIEGGLP